jgi:electron transfer flavoprotein beta subunit
MRAKMQARRQEVEQVAPERGERQGSLEKVRLEAPEEDDREAEVLGEGPDAVPAVVEMLREDVEVL